MKKIRDPVLDKLGSAVLVLLVIIFVLGGMGEVILHIFLLKFGIP